jgi:hypothetical protein
MDNVNETNWKSKLRIGVLRHGNTRTTTTDNTYGEARLTRILLTWAIWRPPTDDSKWQMGFNSTFKGLTK